MWCGRRPAPSLPWAVRRATVAIRRCWPAAVPAAVASHDANVTTDGAKALLCLHVPSRHDVGVAGRRHGAMVCAAGVCSRAPPPSCGVGGGGGLRLWTFPGRRLCGGCPPHGRACPPFSPLYFPCVALRPPRRPGCAAAGPDLGLRSDLAAPPAALRGCLPLLKIPEREPSAGRDAPPMLPCSAACFVSCRVRVVPWPLQLPAWPSSQHASSIE